MTVGRKERILPGFQDPAQDAQAVFRVLLAAMSQPGRILGMPPVIAAAPQDLDPAAAAVCLTLLDGDTTLWTDLDEACPARTWLRFHCGCPFSGNAGRAHFGLATRADRLPLLEAFGTGTDETPETAATLVLQVETLAATGGCTLSGPGIPDRRRLEVAGLPSGFWEQRRKVCGVFPLGLDLVLISGEQLAALPRATQVET